MTSVHEIPGKVVKKSNDFVRQRLQIQDVLSVRILACLASTVREDDTDFRELTISAHSVLEHTGGNDYKLLKLACDKLLRCILEKKLDNKGGFQKYTLFSTVGYLDGVIFAKFHPDLKPFFLDLKSNFTMYDLQEFLRLPSIYSQKLFEYLRSWDDCSERIEPLGKIHEMLGIPDYARKDFKEFRRRVLDKAHRDISDLTSLRYEWEAVRKGNGKTSPVVAIRFLFSPGRMEKRKKAFNTEIQHERNRLFLEAMRCRSQGDCGSPKRSRKCAVCLTTQGIELPDDLRDKLPVYAV